MSDFEETLGLLDPGTESQVLVQDALVPSGDQAPTPASNIEAPLGARIAAMPLKSRHGDIDDLECLVQR